MAPGNPFRGFVVVLQIYLVGLYLIAMFFVARFAAEWAIPLYQDYLNVSIDVAAILLMVVVHAPVLLLSQLFGRRGRPVELS